MKNLSLILLALLASSSAFSGLQDGAGAEIDEYENFKPQSINIKPEVMLKAYARLKNRVAKSQSCFKSTHLQHLQSIIDKYKTESNAESLC